MVRFAAAIRASSTDRGGLFDPDSGHFLVLQEKNANLTITATSAVQAGTPDQGLPGTPPSVDNALPMPPATIWPPLPPGSGIAGKALILVWVVGVGYRWVVVGGTDIWPPPPQPPTAQPK